MKQFHAVMVDETGCEFGVSLKANDHHEATEKLREDYPESRIDQLEDDAQRNEREARMYERLRGEHWDPEHEWGGYDD